MSPFKTISILQTKLVTKRNYCNAGPLFEKVPLSILISCKYCNLIPSESTIAYVLFTIFCNFSFKILRPGGADVAFLPCSFTSLAPSVSRAIIFVIQTSVRFSSSIRAWRRKRTAAQLLDKNWSALNC